MEQNEQITIGSSTYGICLSIGTSLVNSFRLLWLGKIEFGYIKGLWALKMILQLMLQLFSWWINQSFLRSETPDIVEFDIDDSALSKDRCCLWLVRLGYSYVKSGNS